MITSLNQMIKEVGKGAVTRVAVACATENELQLAKMAAEQGIAEFALIGDRQALKAAAGEHGLGAGDVTLIDRQDPAKAAALAMEMVRSGEADLPMKGLLHTSTFMRAALDKESGVGHSRRISQITVFEGMEGRLQFLTDCAINIAPDLECKKQIIQNAVEAAVLFGYENPKVALLGAVEVVNEAMPDTLDSAALTQMNRRGQIKGCIVDGPLSLDNAICPDAARRKGIDSPVAGYADILVAPTLQVGNLLGKALVYYANRPSASVIGGTDLPMIMTSRTDLPENRLMAVAVACYRLQRQRRR